jgi:divalent metal cation (Fe/Co/Zn/Cd) transporter
VFGLVANLLLFLLKLYVSISSNSLSIYCDAINNLGDTFSCLLAIAGFVLAMKLNQRKGNRVQSLCSFVIGALVAIVGAYFVYNGIERMMYPVMVSFYIKYAILVALTIVVKIIIGIVYAVVNKKHSSPVLKALVIDSFLDCAVTATALMGFYLTQKLNFAIDGAVGIVIGIIVVISAGKTVVEQAKYLIND